MRVPLADGTLYALPVGHDDVLLASLLTLSDVMGTGHHAAVTARVSPGKSVAVVGNGAVGLCGVIAARRLGAEHLIMGRHTDPITLWEVVVELITLEAQRKDGWLFFAPLAFTGCFNRHHR